ncbi:beta-galactosidase [Cohnella boryungensis]|uniref:Beta-galactosidase n=1 Tax=Cohnella boryungensis TaxID=768479 RepID=A0ABV8SCS0_9BACL
MRFNEKKAYKGKDFLLGVCYYPEHWPEDMWEDDFRRISGMGFNVVRMGETAWNLLEPEEGKYDFTLFDRAIAISERYGLKIILGTPTYAPPAWLTQKYPEVLRVDFRGLAMAHGSRRHYNYTSQVYLRLCRDIVAAMTAHYGNHPSVIGWQIDNELNCHSDMSFAESDHLAFREWCKEKYGTLKALNAAWGTSFWAQTYSEWSQVFLPKPTVTYHNPSHLLDSYRFTSDSAIRFAEPQYQILKAGIASQQFVTHNGIFGNIDYSTFTERTVDFLSYDSYPSFQLMRKDVPLKEKDRLSGKHLSRMRGYSAKFLILEQQAGPGGQTGNVLNNDRDDYLQTSPKPGQMRLWTWQSIAHGADGVLYFRWRTCPFGAETLWHGLNDYGNQPNRRLEEAGVIAEEVTRLAGTLLATRVAATAAILGDYDNDSNCKIDRHTGTDYWRSEESIYLALTNRHIGTDVLNWNTLGGPQDLKGYSIIFVPNAQIFDSKQAEMLRIYAEQGGTVVLGPRSGYKNRDNHAYMEPFPGVVRKLAGVKVKDFTMVDPYVEHQGLLFSNAGDNGESVVDAPIFHEILSPEEEGVHVAATYAADYYAGMPGVTVRETGRGRIVYFGTFFSLVNSEALLEQLGVGDAAEGWAKLPPWVETVYRTDGKATWAILLNYSGTPALVSFKGKYEERIHRRTLEGELTMNPYDVWMIELQV